MLTIGGGAPSLLAISSKVRLQVSGKPLSEVSMWEPSWRQQCQLLNLISKDPRLLQVQDWAQFRILGPKNQTKSNTHKPRGIKMRPRGASHLWHFSWCDLDPPSLRANCEPCALAGDNQRFCCRRHVISVISILSILAYHYTMWNTCKTTWEILGKCAALNGLASWCTLVFYQETSEHSIYTLVFLNRRLKSLMVCISSEPHS